MKKILLMLMVFVVLFATGASALQLSSATIGNADQDRIKDVSTTVTVTNDGTTNLTNVVMSFAGDSTYNIRFEPTTFNLAAGATQTVTVKGDIPVNFDAVVKNSGASDFLDETPFKIGTIKAASGSTEIIADLNMQAVNQLEIDEVNVVCNDNSERLDDGEEFEELSPDMDCYITVEFENTFNDDDRNDQKIGDIEFDPVYIEVESMDSDLDLDEDDDLDLSADDKDEITFDFELEEDLEDGNYPVEIRVYGIDENNAYHGEMWEIDLEVDRLKHDLKIKSASITPVQMSACSDTRLNVDATVLNIGKRDEEEVVVKAIIPDLELEQKKTTELDEDDSERMTFSFTIPKDTESRVYSLELKTFFDTTALSNTQRFDFVVEECEKTAETTDDSSDDDSTTTVTTSDTSVTTTGATSARVRSASASSFKDSPAYIWLLAGISVLLAVIVIVLLIVLFRRPLDEE
ncbi:hypothetical protein GF358_04555 [Candidatus Woesearchaeota archaeon]|nr:hypothetical protein [Candidatus Woesearchaeota archaeon]